MMEGAYANIGHIQRIKHKNMNIKCTVIWYNSAGDEVGSAAIKAYKNLA